MNAFYVITDARTGNERTSDVVPLLRDYGDDLMIDAIWLNDQGNVEYGQLDVFYSGWSGNETLAKMIGLPIEPLDNVASELEFDELEFDELEFEAF